MGEDRPGGRPEGGVLNAGPGPTPKFYGRRKGKPLRAGRQALIDGLLPALRVVAPAGGADFDPISPFEPRPRAVWIEVGFGGGEHLIHQAASNPDVGLIGIEPYVNGVATALRAIDDGNLANVRLFDDDARLLLPRIAPASVARVFVLFPDPWPKRRHWNRRFINPETLDLLARVLEDGGRLRFASDHMGYAAWALWHVRRHDAFAWTARRAGDWRERPADACPTRYEAKARAAGDMPVFLDFVRRPRTA